VGLLDFLFKRRTDPRGELLLSDQERMDAYARYLRAYRGYGIRGPLNSGLAQELRRLRFNFNRPIINLGAAFMAAKPLTWQIKGDTDATAAAHDIWERSGSDYALLSAARTCSIYGDIGALATQNDAGEPLIEFIDPGLCYPTPDGADFRKLLAFEIAYEQIAADGTRFLHREMYGPTGLQVFDDDRLTESRAYAEMPVAWIRNLSVSGLPTGISDLEGIVDLVEEYDHLAGKQTKIVDYYAAPHIVFSGVSKGSLDLQAGTVLYLPSEGAKAAFLEWGGSPPDVEAQLCRIRNAIAEISQVPAVAFGQQDGGITNLSGIAIQILYGPLIAKTRDKRANWSPALQKLMALCLQAAGFAVKEDDVCCIWPDAMPVDGAEKVTQATALAAAELKSRRSLMADLGVEDPDAELKRILVEQMLVQLPAGAASPAPPDPVMVARAAGKGHNVAEARAAGVQDATPKGGTQQDRVNARPAAGTAPSPGQPAPGEAPAPAPNVGENIAAMLELVDEALDAEEESLAADADDGQQQT
jgi:hypothetical protein